MLSFTPLRAAARAHPRTSRHDLSDILNVSQLANALALASLLTILAAAGAIFGLRDVMNFGHGALFMLGGYLATRCRRAWASGSRCWPCRC